MNRKRREEACGEQQYTSQETRSKHFPEFPRQRLENTMSCLMKAKAADTAGITAEDLRKKSHLQKKAIQQDQKITVQCARCRRSTTLLNPYSTTGCMASVTDSSRTELHNGDGRESLPFSVPLEMRNDSLPTSETVVV